MMVDSNTLKPLWPYVIKTIANYCKLRFSFNWIMSYRWWLYELATHYEMEPFSWSNFTYKFDKIWLRCLNLFCFVKWGKIYANKTNTFCTHAHQETTNKSGLLKHPNKIINNFIMHNQVLYVQKNHRNISICPQQIHSNFKRFSTSP